MNKKKEKFLNAVGNIDDKLIEKANETPVRKKLTEPKKKFSTNTKWVIAAACLCLAVIVALPLFIIGGEDYPVKKVFVKSEGATESSIASVIISRWNEMDIFEQYNVYGDYTATSHILPKGNIENLIDTTALKGYDEYNPEAVHEIIAEVYSIKGINSNCAVAVKFDGTNVYYTYLNSHYRPETLRDFANDLNLLSNLSFGTLYYSYMDKNELVDIEFYGITLTEVWKLLFEDNLDVKNVHDDAMWLIPEMSISTNLDYLGISNLSISVTKDGYLHTNLLSTGKTFYIGEEKAEAFFKYVKENLEGCRIEYVYENIPEENDNTSTESYIVQYDVETGKETIIKLPEDGSTETGASTESRGPSN